MAITTFTDKCTEIFKGLITKTQLSLSSKRSTGETLKICHKNYLHINVSSRFVPFLCRTKTLFDVGLPRKRINEPILNPDDLGDLECDENRFAISLDSIYNDYNRFVSN